MIAPTLETQRLRLKSVALDQFEEQQAFMADPRVMAFIGGGNPRTRQESWMKFCQSAGMWTLLGYGYWAFTDRATGALVGLGGLGQFERGIDQLIGFPEAGWAFAADEWGKGFATEAMEAVLRWADVHLDAREIRCIIDPENVASLSVARKLGFVAIDQVEDELGVSIVHSRKAK